MRDQSSSHSLENGIDLLSSMFRGTARRHRRGPNMVSAGICAPARRADTSHRARESQRGRVARACWGADRLCKHYLLRI